MGTLTIECVRRPEGSRNGRNGAYVVLLGPQSMSLPGGISTIQNAPRPIWVPTPLASGR